MVSATLPLNLLSGVEKLSYLAENWTLRGACSSGKNRQFVFQVVFERPFATTPILHLGIVGLDISNEDYSRLTVRAEGLGPEGFNLVAETWFDSQIFRVDVSWLALGH
jgi:hypothetical protein